MRNTSFLILLAILAFLPGFRGKAQVAPGQDPLLEQAQDLVLTHPDSGIQVSKGLIRTAVNEGNAAYLLEAKLVLVQGYQMRGDLDSAENLAEECIRISRSVSDSSNMARSLISLGEALEQKGEFDSSLVHLFEGVGIAQRNADSTNWAYGLKRIGIAYYYLGDFDRAETYFRDAGSFFTAMGNFREFAAIKNNLGLIALQNKDFELAKQAFREAITFNEQVKDYKKLGDSYNNYATVHYYQGNYDEAEEAWLTALAYREQIQHLYGIAECQMNLAQFYHQKGLLQKGIAMARRSLASAQKLGSLEMERGALLNLSINYREIRLDSAIYFLDSMVLVERRLNQASYLEESAELEAKYQSKQKELEIARLAQASAEKEAMINRREFWTAVIVSILALVLLVGIFILLSYLRTLRSNRLLNERNEIISSQNDELKDKNERLVELNHEATLARARAEEAFLAKSAFLANMSHEIRTPLHGVIGLTEIMHNTSLDEEQHKYIRSIRSSGENLLRIVNEVLDFSKIEAGKMELEETELRLQELMDDILVLFTAQSSEKDLDLACLIDPALPRTLLGDPHKFRQVMINLIGNALKFTEKGEVFIHLKRLPKLEEDKRISLRVEVHDSGIGISPEHSARLFKAFQQAHKGISRKFGGTGLGLTISNELVKLMGGQLEFKSQPEQGTCFSFELELAMAETGSESGSALDRLKKECQGSSILVLEPRNRSAEVVLNWLTELGMEPIRPHNSAEVKLHLEGSSHAMIFYGIGWQGSEGDDLLEFFQQKEEAITVPLILIGNISELGRLEQLSIFDDSLSRPLTHSSFLEVMSNIFLEQANGYAVEVRAPIHENNDLGITLPLEILVADDDKVNQMVAMRIFANLGYHPDIADDGKEVLDRCAQHKYDLIFMDVNMPTMNGLEATKKLHATYLNGDRPRIIAMTANAMEADRKTCLEAGMDNYMSKPFRIDNLQSILLHYGLKKKELGRKKVISELRSRENDLNQIAFHLSQKRKFIEEISSRLTTLQKEPSFRVKSEISALIREFNNHRLSDRSTQALQSDMDKVNVSFYKRLEEQFPALTENEKELCGLLVLRLSTKDIANLRNVLPNSVKKARQRIRKKLSLTEDQDLTLFLENL